MSKSKNFEAKFIAAKSDSEKLKKIFQITEVSEICSTILKVKEELGLSIWSTVLSNLDDEEKVFDFIEELLPKLNRDQLSTKVLNDFYSRLCIELSRYSLEFCVKFAHFCEGRIQFGDPRACFFKDCLPCILQILAKADRSVTFDGVTKMSSEYREQIIKGILDKPFKVTILTAITSMFKDIPLEKNQTKQLLGKICDNFSNVSHKEISGLALACFNLALFKRLDIPVLALDTYFYNKRYKKKFLEMESESDVESIDETAEKGLIETEDNVIFHFQHVTEFTSIEHMLEKALKPLAFAPKFIISPFIATILVSFAKMSSSSVSGNLRLPQSILLPFIKKVFKNNENHREILRQSAWARSVDQFEPIDIEKLLQVLQENTCKLGQNIALNGFIGLTFMLLKTKNAPTLNSFSIKFLNELCKHRQEFASDIMKIVVKMLFSETNKAPIIECFSIMIQNRSLPIHLCEEALTDLVENLTELELETALAIESVIFNAVSKSSKLRELMSSTMRAAMYQNKRGMRKLAVFSFCVMLKKVTKPPQAGAHEAFVPTQNISMMSLMSQSQLPSTEKASMRRVSVLVLEILGILRKCFSHSVDVRETLYESLLKAVTANPFIIPNVLELVEPYFRDYFDSEDPGEIMNFSKAFKQDDEGNVIVTDHLGKFLEFIVGCIEVAETKIKEDGNAQLKNYQKVIESLTTKILDVTLENLEIFSTLDTKVSKTITQFLNCLEVLMAHNSRSLNRSFNILNLTKLIEKHHQMTLEAKKLQESNKKSIKRGKNQTEVAAPKVEIDFECIWDLETCEKFVGVAFLDNPNETINQIKQNKGFVLFVLNSTSSRIQQLQTAPDYLKLKYSRSSFAALKSISSILYMELELESFEALYDRFDIECAVTLTEAFKNVLIVMDSIYNTPTKWQEFFKKTSNTSHDTDKMNVEVIKRLQRIIDRLFDPEREEISNDSKGEKTVLNLFMAMELLFKNFQNIPNAFAREAYNWLLKFCKETEIDQKNLHVINKVLFQVMSQQDADNTMMEHIADKISSIYGCLEENIAKPLDVSQNDIKTITKTTVELSFKHFCDVIKKQIVDVEFCILRMNSFNAHVKIPGQDSRNESVNALQSLEKSCVVKLTHLGRVLARLLNSQFNTKGIQIETAGRVATNYFTCLCNLIKHLLQHFAVKTLDFTIIPLEMLMKQTKITSKVAFLLAPYAEDAYQEDQKQTAKDKKEKKKIVAPKEFKFVTGLVRTIGNFLKSVQRLDEQTKRNFSKFIYTGDVRDFRIDMKKTGNLTREKSVEETVVSSDEEVAPESDSDTPIQLTRKRSRIIQSRSSSENEDSDATDVSKEIQQPIRRGGFEENIKKLCAKGAKRKRK